MSAERITLSRIRTLQVFQEVNDDLKQKGAYRSSAFVMETAKKMIDKWWPKKFPPNPDLQKNLF